MANSKKLKCPYCDRMTFHKDGICSDCNHHLISFKPIAKHDVKANGKYTCTAHGPHYVVKDDTARFGGTEYGERCLQCPDLATWARNAIAGCSPCRGSDNKYTTKSSCYYCWTCRQEEKKEKRFTKTELAMADRMSDRDVTDVLDFQ